MTKPRLTSFIATFFILKDFFMAIHFYLLFYYLPIERIISLNLNKLESPELPSFHQVWLKMPQLFSRRRYFNFIHLFSLSIYYIFFGKGKDIHLNIFYTKMCCTKFGWNWPSGSGEDFYWQCFYFLNILLLYPLEKEHDFSFEQTLILFTKRILCSKF